MVKKVAKQSPIPNVQLYAVYAITGSPFFPFRVSLVVGGHHPFFFLFYQSSHSSTLTSTSLFL